MGGEATKKDKSLPLNNMFFEQVPAMGLLENQGTTNNVRETSYRTFFAGSSYVCFCIWPVSSKFVPVGPMNIPWGLRAG